MKKVGLLFNARIAKAGELAQELERSLGQAHTSVWVCPATDGAKAKEQLVGTEMIVSLGGDGTMLRAARLAAPEAIPILGVNMGNLGFTTELTGSDVRGKIANFLAGGGWIDERAMLEVTLPPSAGGHAIHAMNDVVVARGGIVRVIRVKASVNGQPITTYKADGVIVATATGATGYSLSAGGPILFPGAREFLLTPIMSHLGLTASLVLPSKATVELEVQTAHDARVSIDGQVEFPLISGDVIRVKRSPHTVRLLRIQPPSFFYETLLRKLGGGQE